MNTRTAYYIQVWLGNDAAGSLPYSVFAGTDKQMAIRKYKQYVRKPKPRQQLVELYSMREKLRKDTFMGIDNSSWVAISDPKGMIRHGK